MLVFESVEEETRVPGKKKTLRAEYRTNKTQPTYYAESGNQSWDTLVEGEHSHPCTNPAPHKERCMVRFLQSPMQ